jgi:hypothetical protein
MGTKDGYLDAGVINADKYVINAIRYESSTEGL